LSYMAFKRRISTKAKISDENDPDQDAGGKGIPVRQRRDPGWRYWLTHEYAKYWYLLGSLFLDLFLFLEAYTQYWVGVAGVVIVIVVIGLVLLEFWGYGYLWGKKGRLS
jgi:hypothetical protein